MKKILSISFCFLVFGALSAPVFADSFDYEMMVSHHHDKEMDCCNFGEDSFLNLDAVFVQEGRNFLDLSDICFDYFGEAVFFPEGECYSAEFIPKDRFIDFIFLMVMRE